jgi:hypothetical protein
MVLCMELMGGGGVCTCSSSWMMKGCDAVARPVASVAMGMPLARMSSLLYVVRCVRASWCARLAVGSNCSGEL